MTYTDSADNSDKSIDAYLYGKQKGGMTDTGDYGSPQGKNGTQPKPQDIEKILSSMPKMPPPPKLHDMPKPSEQQYQSPLQGFSGPIMFLASLASLMTRHPAQTAMNSFSAMVNANLKGQKQQMDEARENWKASMDWTVKQNEIELDRYKLIMEKYKENADAMVAHMMVAATGFNDPIMAAAAKSGNMGMVYDLLKDRESQSDKLRDFGLRQDELEEKKEHDRAMEGGQVVIDDETANYAAERVLAGDKTALQNFGRGRQGSANLAKIQSRVAELAQERNLPPDAIAKAQATIAGMTQYQRTGGTYAARVESATNEVAQVAPLALSSSKDLARGEFVPLNTLIQKLEAGKSDPRYYQFAVNNFSLKNAYTRAMNPTGSPRVAERVEQRADHLFDMATDQQSYLVMVQQIIKEVQASKRAIAAMRSGNDEDMDRAMMDILNEKTDLNGGAGPVKVGNPEEARALKRGTHYITPDGQEFTR